MKNAPEVAVEESGSKWTRHTFGGVNAASWVAICLTFGGWFVLDTLHVAWGPLERGVRFYDLAVVIGSPVRLFTGIDGHRGASVVVLIALCFASLLSALLPHVWHNRRAWIALGAPSALMLIVALLLYWRISDDALIANLGAPDTIGHDIRHLTDHVLRHLRANAARGVILAPGAYLASIGSLLLLARGVRGFVSR